MFKILQEGRADTVLVTIGYPRSPATIPEHFRGAPSFDFSAWRDARSAAEACPTGAIAIGRQRRTARSVTIDYGFCIYCGACAEADDSGAVTMTREFELAARRRGQI